VRYTRGNVAADIDIACTVVASIHRAIETPDVTARARLRAFISVHVRRPVLEWRADPTNGWHDPSLAGERLGVDAADLDGGFEAWAGAGLAVE
jgi:hypothetical protein